MIDFLARIIRERLVMSPWIVCARALSEPRVYKVTVPALNEIVGYVRSARIPTAIVLICAVGAICGSEWGRWHRIRAEYVRFGERHETLLELKAERPGLGGDSHSSARRNV